MIVALIALSIWLYVKLKAERKQRDKLSAENAQLIADNALFEAEHLKFQLQPHTLNNILANLKVIANKLNKGLASLSETLEYILYKGNNHLVSVRDEITFVKEYINLNKLFITDIDMIKENFVEVNTTSKYYSTPCIPHLITAYFLENAFKHGDTNHKDFLSIQIKLTDKEFELKVRNKVNPKPNPGKGGLGLTNMKKRLELLSANKYNIDSQLSNGEYLSTLTIYF